MLSCSSRSFAGKIAPKTLAQNEGVFGEQVNGGAARARPDPSLIKAIVLAHGWAAALEKGAASVATIAAEAGVTKRYVWKILRLAFLAPDIVEAILDGLQPPDLTLRRINEKPLPLSWAQQRQALGFRARAA